jgi:hypothetical protein
MAVQYAHAHAQDYGGGRGQVRCEGQAHRRDAMATLAPALRIDCADAA